jgi:hypothetical protein
MADNEEHSNDPGAETPPTDSVNLQDLALDLNFVPTWARKPSTDSNPYENRDGGSGDSRGSRPPRRDQPRRNGPPRDGNKDRPANRRDFQDRRGDQRGSGRPQQQDNNRRRPMQEERVYLPVDISFIPDRDRLGAVVRQLHTVKRAFPLTYISSLFLSKPEYHMLKLEARPNRQGDPIQFFQCRESKAVFLNRDDLMGYLVRTQLDKYFDRVELVGESPTGNFVCVGQCKRSGIVIGPPNYHGYNERLLDVHRTHFPQLSFDQYRNSIEMNREPAVIEQWKESCKTQIRYRPKDTPDAEATLTVTQAESVFLEKYAAALIQTGSKVILPAIAVAKIEDERLRQVLNAAWSREDRFPLSLMLALRPAFRRMRLHLFKAGKDETFVTAIPPKPLDAEHAIPSIKDMVSLISAHPGWSRKQLVEKMFPGKSPDDPEVTEKMNPLIWLVDKGHIIEFFNGTYAVPGHLKTPGAVPSEAPQEHHHPESATAAPEIVPDAAPVDQPAND